MTTTIITTQTLSTKPIEFKDKRLAEATKKITAIYNDAVKYAETKNRDISAILHQVSSEQSFKKDGFKSVADYAEQVFGIKKQNAYALANAGAMYASNNVPAAAKALSPSKLSELAGLPKDAIEDGFKSGKINADSTQKELRDYSKAVKATMVKEDAKPVVLKEFTVKLIGASNEVRANLPARQIMDDWDTYFKSFGADVEVIPLPKGKASPDADKPTVTRKLYLYQNGPMVVEFYTYKAPKEAKPAKSDKPQFSTQQLIEMLRAQGIEVQV